MSSSTPIKMTIAVVSLFTVYAYNPSHMFCLQKWSPSMKLSTPAAGKAF
ncbi:MAG: hypothetical protein WCC52_09635 [Nitrosotalea sp.]